ncbi:MAG: hypothetical protein BWY11_01997 [Firmicutes bacterium ADurb.Bin182]|nr:MAG: hypothetical protein BWY11_01997 [Firmicutes bacterium ADurb.Bin182]
MLEKERNFIEGRKDECEVLQGNVVELELKKEDCEVRADIKVKRKNCIRIWGRVVDCFGDPVEDALVKLIKKIKMKESWKFEGVAHTLTDCEGFYQFDICGEECKANYRIIVSKAAMGKERTVFDDECEPCFKDRFKKEWEHEGKD